ncbi:MAG TPA: DUF751 domain-containing protein [Cyanobacteria bacterium UBA11049]|nr:DUF751 domain-containing protein [Cyanobacteria bacterium UBA11049]
MQDFWNRVSRYPTFFVTIILGVFWNAIEPLMPFLKRPVTAIPLISLFIAGFVFIALTLRAMLGLNPV